MEKKVKSNVEWVGKVDWELQKFHGNELSTFRGTTYNSYLVREEKNVLIDTVWKPYAGDFMEYHGWIESAGASSRKCKFEAYKVIELARDPKLAMSAANVLKEPLLVGKATGTLIVQKQFQRGAQDPKFALKK